MKLINESKPITPKTLIQCICLTLCIGLLLGAFLLGLIITSVQKEIIASCEKELPRTKHCKIATLHAVQMTDQEEQELLSENM